MDDQGEPQDGYSFRASAFTTDEWRKGVTLHSWVMECAPDVIEDARFEIIGLAGGLAKDHFTENAALIAERRVHREVKRKLDSRLLVGLGAGLYVLGMPPASANESVLPVSADALDEVIEGIDWWPALPSARYSDNPLALRLYRPGRFGGAEIAALPDDPAPISNLGRALPSEAEVKLYTLVCNEVEKIENPLEHFAVYGNKAAFVRKLAEKKVFTAWPYKASSITRELTTVLGDLKPDS